MNNGFLVCDTCGRKSTEYDTENSVFIGIDEYDENKEVVRCERCRELNKFNSDRVAQLDRATAS